MTPSRWGRVFPATVYGPAATWYGLSVLLLFIALAVRECWPW